jgi:predicted MFS family arabinose efflux permease
MADNRRWWAIVGAGAAIGLLAGGLLTEYLDWCWCLYVNVPVALVTFAGAWAILTRGERHPDAHLDVPGALLGSAGMLSLVYGFSEAESRSWGDGLLVTIGMFGVFLFLTYYMQGVLGWSPLKTGCAYLPMTAAMIVGSTQIAARLLGRVQPRFLIVPGLLVGAGGLAIIAQVGVEPAYASHVLPGMLMLGLGMSTAMMTSVSLATGSVAPRDSGAASATFNTAQQVGGSIGTALLNTIAASVTARYAAAHAGAGVDRQELAARATVHGFNVATWWAMASLLLAAVVAGVVVNAERAPTPQGAGVKEAEPVDLRG